MILGMEETNQPKQSENLQDSAIEQREEWRPDDFLPSYQPRIWPLWIPLAVYFCGIFVSSLASLLYLTGMQEVPMQIIGMLVQDSIWIILPILIACIALKHQPRALGLTKPPVKIALVAIPLGILFYLMNTMGAIIVDLLAPGKIASSQTVVNLFGQTTSSVEIIMLVLLICFAAPVAEEMLFRAFLYPSLLHYFKRPIAIILCAAAFSLAHMNIWTFLPIFIGGLGFTWLYDKYRNLWVNAIAHMAWNSLVIILLFVLNNSLYQGI